ncbi:MAG: cell division protein FtsL [Gammaproteobacteria bacterium]
MIGRATALVLALAALLSALQLVIARHDSRRLFVELQGLESQRDGLNEEWTRLQLEDATWGTHGRVEDIARSRLAMVRPGGSQVVLISQ